MTTCKGVFMDRAEIKSKVNELLSSGTGQAEVFARLSGQGVKDSQLASLIASYPDPLRCKQHRWKVNVLIFITLIQAVIGCLIIFDIGEWLIEPSVLWLLSALGLLICLVFAWGFHTNRVRFYNICIVLSGICLGQSLVKDIMEGRALLIDALIGAIIGIGFIAYVWYVREKIFPTPKQINGKYVFVD
jgi:hypothetical protein